MEKKLKRIILHWSVGRYNQYFWEHYHFFVDDKGRVQRGKYFPVANVDCSDGEYCPHTGGGNTGSIGICMNGMLGYKNRFEVGDYPLTKPQVEACCKQVAKLMIKYNISLENVMTHAEFGLANPNTTSKGKIDICWLPYGLYGIKHCGDFLRNKINWYYQKIKEGKIK